MPEDISLDDISTAVEALKDYDEYITENTNNPSTASGAGSSGVSGSSGGSGSYSSGSSSSVSNLPKTYDNMSIEELNQEMSDAQTDLSKKQTALDEASNGTSPELTELKSAEEEAYENYQTELENAGVSETIRTAIDWLNDEINNKETEISQNKADIANKESEIIGYQTELNTATSNLKTLQTALSALQTINTSSMDANDQAEIANSIDDLQNNQIPNAQDAVTKAQSKLTTAQDEKEDLENQLTANENFKKIYKGQLARYEADCPDLYNAESALSKAKQEWNTAQENFNEEQDKAITEAGNAVIEAQNNISEIQAAIDNYNNEQTLKEYCFNDFGEEIIDFAKQFLGCNESDGSADKFLGGSSSAATPWCAAFVQYCIENSVDDADIADWYSNIENKWYVPDIYDAAHYAGAVLDPSEVQTGDIVMFSQKHIGLVVEVQDDGTLVTIEGNTSDQVANRTYNVYDSTLTFCRATNS